MYHDVIPAPASTAGGGPDRFSVSLASFETMLDAIAEEGRRGCSVGEVLTADDADRVAITFDDGTTGQFRYAAPALRERNMSATFFVTTDFVGRPGFMSWDDLRTLREWGMSVQSHTSSHPHLSQLGEEDLRRELVESRATLDRELGQETSELALPGGNAPRWRLRRLLAESGYRVVATSRWGWNRGGSASGRYGVRWIKRCTVPAQLDRSLARRIISGDLRLAARRYPREVALNGVRALLGADRYARWRRRLLDAVAG